jgi:hypothetical protein
MMGETSDCTLLHPQHQVLTAGAALLRLQVVVSIPACRRNLLRCPQELAPSICLHDG